MVVCAVPCGNIPFFERVKQGGAFTHVIQPARDQGIAAIEELMTRRGKFDYILLETTGIADPVPIMQMCWLDDGLKSSLYLDGVVTVVDALHAHKQLVDMTEKQNEAQKYALSLVSTRLQHSKAQHRQIACADRILINKIDLVTDKAQLTQLEDTLRRMNPFAEMQQASRASYHLCFRVRAFIDT